MALLVEGRKLLFAAETSEENNRWYLYLLCKNSELTYLRKLQVTKGIPAPGVLRFLRQPLITKLNLDNVPLPLDALVALSAPLRIHECVVHLSLRYAELDDLSLHTICESLKTNSAIEVLDLEGNQITADGMKKLAVVLEKNPKLKSINLRRNGIGDEGAKHLARVLQTGVHPGLTTLQLDYNQIGPVGAESLAQGLVKLPNFPVVALNGNQIGDRGT